MPRPAVVSWGKGWYNGEKTGGGDMRKHIAWLTMAVLAAVAVTFGVLWQSALRNHSDLEMLARTGASEACTRFSDFRKLGDDGDYWGGVAAFHTFQQAHILLTEGTSQAADRVFCSEVYGALLLKPELAKAHMAEVIEVMEMLSQDVTDANAYLRMAELGNTLAR